MCKYVIVGKRGSGKKRCLDEFIKNGLNPMSKYTTKPRKCGMGQGKHFTFVSKALFEKMMDNNKFIYVEKRKKDMYGITADYLEYSDVAILSYNELCVITHWFPNLLKLTSIIFLDVPDNIRKRELKHRYSGDNVDERIEQIIKEDNKKFKNFNNFDIVSGSVDEALRVINKLTHQNEDTQF